MNRQDTADYKSLFLRDTPLMDTRAPVEFARGAFPTAVNLPLLSDEERHQVGICYKESGQAAAIELGQSLVTGDTRDRRLKAWCHFARDNPQGYLYCFRGGLRSATVQQWMREAGTDYPLVLGGYKAMRRFLLENLEHAVAAGRFVLVAGKTGTGKTRVIEAVSRALDLEALARHRGSSFGHLLEPQPSQIDFENALSIALLRCLHDSSAPILIEDEGRLIGRVSLPDSLREKMQTSPLLVVEETLASRVEVILDDYVRDLGERYRRQHAEEGPLLHEQHLREGLARIQRRLGGSLHHDIDARIEEAFDTKDLELAHELHRCWIEILLSNYYDPMYDYQMRNREGEVLGRGSREGIISQAKVILRQ
jgi:tRNA 2-selenouridine synthase